MIFIDKGIEKIIQFEATDTEHERQLVESLLAFLIATIKRFREVESDIEL